MSIAGFPYKLAYWVTTVIHTPPEGFGKLMSMVEPRLAVAYHYWNHRDIELDIHEGVRKTYDGPVSMAVDYMVWNVTKDDLRVRMSTVDEEVWPSPAIRPKLPPDTSKMIPFSDFTKSGAVAFPEVVKPIYDEINKDYGLNEKQD